MLLWVFSCMNCVICTNTLCVWFLLEPISFDPPFSTITSCVPKHFKSFTRVFTISFVVAPGLIQLQTSNFVFRYWSIFEAVHLRWLSPKIFTLWLTLVPVVLFFSSFFLVIGFQSPPCISLPFIIVGIFIPFLCWFNVSFAFCVDFCPVCFLCPCSACSLFDSALLSCRLFSGVNLFVVTMY